MTAAGMASPLDSRARLYDDSYRGYLQDKSLPFHDIAKL